MKLTPIKTLVVYRDLWVRGGTAPLTRLLNEHGMCCLGFASLAVGVPASAIRDKARPGNIFVELGTEIPGLNTYSESACCHVDTELTRAAMAANDSQDVTGAQREALLTADFAAAPDPIALTFQDTAPPELRAQYEAGLK